jgi:hypothetical protein
MEQGRRKGMYKDKSRGREVGGKSSRILLNIGTIEGSVRSIQSEEFSMSSKLSDRLCK